MANPIGGFWSRLSPRERTYILVLVLTFFVMGTLLLLYMRSSALSDVRDRIEAHRLALDKVYTKGSVYQERLEEKKAREASIAANPVAFATLLEEAQAGVEDVTVADQEEPAPLDLGDGLLKRTFEFKLRSVSLENLMKLLTSIESKPKRVILTEELVIRSPSATEDRLNVDVRIATWERRDVADEDEEGEEDEEEDQP